MPRMDDQQLPDFEFVNTFGEIVTSRSLIHTHLNLLFVSIRNRIVVYDFDTKDKIYEIVDRQRYEISAFAVDLRDGSLLICAGFENGIIKIYKIDKLTFRFCPRVSNSIQNYNSYEKECIDEQSNKRECPANEEKGSALNTQGDRAFQNSLQEDNSSYKVAFSVKQDPEIERIAFINAEMDVIAQFRPHVKAVTHVAFYHDYIYSASLDRSSVLYNRTSEEVEISYEGNSAKIYAAAFHNNCIFAACSDKTLKIWAVHDENLTGVFAFASEIADFGLFQDFCVVFMADGSSEIVNYRTHSRKAFNTFKKLRCIKIAGDQLYVLTKEKIFGYAIKVPEGRLSTQQTVEGYKTDQLTHISDYSRETDNIDENDTHDSSGCKKDLLTFTDLFSHKLSNEYIDLFTKSPETLVLLSKGNRIDLFDVFSRKTNKFLMSHTSQIFKSMLIDDFIVSVSANEAIVWDAQELLLSHQIVFDAEVLGADQLGNLLIVNTRTQMFVYDIKSGLTMDVFDITTKAFSCYENHLVCEIDESISLFQIIFNSKTTLNGQEINGIRHPNDCVSSFINSTNIKLGITETINVENGHSFSDNFETPQIEINIKEKSTGLIKIRHLRDIHVKEPISCLKISPSLRFIAAGILSNNNIYLYDLNTGDLRLKLFGHSLPVRHISFNPTESTILSCGADKLVKLWGTDFGECRKSFIGDTDCASFVAKDAFIFADQSIKYYHKHGIVKTFKSKHLRYCKFLGDRIIATSAYGIHLFRMENNNNFENDEDSEIELEILTKHKIVNTCKYELFCNAIDDVEEKGTDTALLENILVNIDLAELDKFCFFLNISKIRILLRAACNLKDIAIIVSARILNSIFKFHGHLCENDPEIFSIWKQILMSMFHFRNEIGAECAYLEHIKDN